MSKNYKILQFLSFIIVMHLTSLTLKETSDGLNRHEFSSVELTRAYLDRIERLNPSLNAYLTVATESALEAAKAADERRAKGENGALLGVPIAVKDNMMTVGIRTTAASKMLEDYAPSYDATVVKKIKDAGAVILGKTNLDEWAHGSSTENSAFGPTKNPWDLTRVPGGSSGGSAAAVAADLCAGALGSDTGGSIRGPAGFCGVVGLKTSYGRVSRSGLLAMTSSTDVIGPMTKTAADAALLLQVIAGADQFDQTTYPESPKPHEYQKAIEGRSDLKGLKFGVPVEWLESTGLTQGVSKATNEAIEEVKRLGGEIKKISLPYARYGIPVYYVITPSEVSANLSRYDGIRYGYRDKETANLFEVYTKSRGVGFGAEAKRRIMLGTYTLSHGYYDAYYLKAQKVRTLIAREIENVLKTVDAVIGPVSPHVAFKIGAQTDDPLKMYLEDVYMGTASLAGLPSLALPCGFALPEKGKEKMPAGLQLIGRRFDEATLLAIGNVYEKATGWGKSKPVL